MSEQVVLTAEQTGSWPVYWVGGYRYELRPVLRVGDDRYRLYGLEFDVRDLAADIPHFEAGETVQEHASLMLMALCRPEPLLDQVRGLQGV